MRVLVTGGSGFIGWNLVKALSGRGYVVRALDIVPPVDPEPIAIDFRISDIRDSFALERALQDIDFVFHMAGIVGVPACAEAPADSEEINVSGTKTLLDLLKIKKETNGSAPAILIASSASVNSSSLFGAQKKEIEEMAVRACAEYSIHLAMPRFFNVYPDLLQISSLEELDRRDVVSQFLFAGIRKKQLEIFGTGEQIRDFVSIEDIVDLCLCTINTQFSAWTNGPFDVGSGEGLRIRDLAELIAENLGVGCNFIEDARYSGEHTLSVADNEVAKNVFQWSPKRDLVLELSRFFTNYPALINHESAQKLSMPITKSK